MVLALSKFLPKDDFVVRIIDLFHHENKTDGTDSKKNASRLKGINVILRITKVQDVSNAEECNF